MASATEHFGYAVFDFGDSLDSTLNIQKEIDRFTAIDTQIYAMANVFGNGVINGWEITEDSGLVASISAGVGLISSISCESTFPEKITLLPNTITYIYVTQTSTSTLDGTVSFYTSPTANNTTGLLLSKVTTGGINIISIDNTVRTSSGYQAVVANAIATHRHDGVTASKIDLTQEVQGQLPNSRMSDIEASKIVGGKLSTKVLPTQDHSQLRNIGELTHPQLDSIVQNIQNDNIALLGEVASINLLKLICAQKYINPDVDKYMENELAIIPGISPDSYIDFVNSTAHINTTDNYISGIAELPFDLDGNGGSGTSGDFEILSVNWETDSDFNTAVALTNLTVKNGVKLSVDTTADKILETFDDGTVDGDVSGYGPSLTETNVNHIVYDASSPAQGPLSAKIEITNERSSGFTKGFASPQDWSSYDKITVFVKSISDSHASLSLGMYNSSGDELSLFPLLSETENTSLDNPDTNGFAKKEFDLPSDTTDVAAIKIFTNTIVNASETFYIDTIYLSSTQYLLPQGNIRLRYLTAAPVVFSSIDYAGEIPAGTDLRVRAKVADDQTGLATATFTSLLNSGETFDLAGSAIEIDVTFLSDSGKTLTPLLTQIFLTFLTPATSSGMSINTSEQWLNGTVQENITVSDDVVTMTNTNIGNIYFVNSNQVSEVDPGLVPVVGISSQNMPITPGQAQTSKTVSSTSTAVYPPRTDARGLFNPRSAYRQISGNYLIADTGNDRVIEVKADGTFVRGYASHNFDYSDLLYALTANYNPRLGVLFITLSKTTDIQNFNLNDIVIKIGSTTALRLDPAVDKIRTLKGEYVTASTTSGLLDRTLSVLLETSKRELLDSTSEAVTISIVADINNLTTSQTVGMECFIGDYMYFGAFGIASPIYADSSMTDRIIVANSAVTSFSTAIDTVVSIIEFSTDIGELIDGNTTPIGLTFSYENILFSDIMLGSAKVYELETTDGVIERKLLMAGIYQIPVATTTTATTLPTDDTQKMQLFKGIVKLVDMDSLLTSFQYISPDGMYPSDAYFDSDDNVVVAESSFTAQAGRIITIDPTGIGDGSVPPIIRLIEGGLFTKVWDVRGLNGNHIFAST